MCLYVAEKAAIHCIRLLVSFCLPQKEKIRQKFVEDLRKEFAGKGLTFSIGTIRPRGSWREVAVGCALELGLSAQFADEQQDFTGGPSIGGKHSLGISLAVQWLRHCTPKTGGHGFDP